MDYDTMRRSLAMRDTLAEQIRAVQDPAASTVARVSKAHTRAIAEALMLSGYANLDALAEYVDSNLAFGDDTEEDD